MNMRLIFLGLCVGIIGIGGVVWVISGQSDNPSAQQALISQSQKPEPVPVKVGVILPLSGPLAFRGLSAQSIMQFAVDQVNASGGVEGQSIELMFRDGECRGEVAAEAVEKLASADGIRIFVGGFCTEETIGMMPAITKFKAFLVSPYSPGALDSEKSPLFVSMYPDDAARIAAFNNLAVNIRQIKKIAVLEPDNAGARDFTSALKADLGRFNGEVVSAPINFQSSASLESGLGNLRSSNPGALYIHTDNSVELDQAFKAMRARKWPIPIILSIMPMMNTDFVLRSASSLEGVLVFDYQDGMDSGIQTQFIRSYASKNQGDLPPSLYGAYVQFDTVFMLANAMNAVGEEPAAIADWFRSIRGIVGLSGPITIGSDGARLTNYIPAIFKKGVLKTL